MSEPEVYHFFKAKRAHAKEKRSKNRESSLRTLQEKQVPFEAFNRGAHLKVRKGDEWVDFWPGTGLWKHGEVQGRGVFKLLRYIGVDSCPIPK